MSPATAALRTFRLEAASVLLARAWRDEGEADERALLDAIAPPDAVEALLEGAAGAAVRATGFDPGVQLLVEVTRQAELKSGPPGGWLRRRGASASRAFDEVRRAIGPDLSDRVWAELARVRADTAAPSERALPAAYVPMLLEWLGAVAEELSSGGPTAEAEPTDLHWLRALSDHVLHTAEPIVLRGASAFRVSVDVEAALDPGLRLVRAWIRPAEELEPPLLPPDVWLRVHHAYRGRWFAWPWCPLPVPPGMVEPVLAIPSEAVVAVELRVGGPGRGEVGPRRGPPTGEARGG